MKRILYWLKGLASMLLLFLIGPKKKQRDYPDIDKDPQERFKGFM